MELYKKNKGWKGESSRHRNAKMKGHAGEVYHGSSRKKYTSKKSFIKSITKDYEKKTEPHDDLELKGLGMFSGSQQYHQGYLNTDLTDGVHYVSENGYSWFVTDALSVIKTDRLPQDFLVVKLKRTGNSEADMLIEDGNKNVLHKQHYKYTDAKKDLTLYFQNNVLMLSSEY